MPQPILGMPQPILIGLIAAMGMLAAAILGLVGVLVGTRLNWKLGKRTGDIQQAGVGIQQQSVDIERNTELFEENQKLRKENQEQYTANRQLRQDAEAAGKEWEEERKGWQLQISGFSLNAEDDKRTIAALRSALDAADAECRIALAAQAAAEGGLKMAMKTLSDLAPCP